MVKLYLSPYSKIETDGKEALSTCCMLAQTYFKCKKKCCILLTLLIYIKPESTCLYVHIYKQSGMKDYDISAKMVWPIYKCIIYKL